LAFAVPWLVGGLAVGPAFLRGDPIQPWIVGLLFAGMLLGPSCAGVARTWAVDGRSGLRELAARARRWRVDLRWYGVALLLFPLAVAGLLAVLAAAVDARFAPGFVPIGVALGLLAGFFEEIGWTGFALPRLQARFGWLRAALILGPIWGVWHLLADFLGSSVQLGHYWLPHFVAFVVAMTATRVLMTWVYQHTGSMLLAQLMHASSTGSLAALGPVGLAPADETLWFAVYAALVSGVAVAVVGRGWGDSRATCPTVGH
jgi:membrane protease YdiL (CAAX protease family)